MHPPLYPAPGPHDLLVLSPRTQTAGPLSNVDSLDEEGQLVPGVPPQCPIPNRNPELTALW